MKTGKKISISQCVLYIALLILLIVSFYPILWMFLSSFKSINEIYQSALAFPKEFDFFVYSEAIRESGFFKALGNIDLWPALIMYGDYMMQLTTPDTITGLNDGSIKWSECEAVLSTFEAMQKLGTSGALISGYESLDHISANQAWAAGKALFMYCGTWWPSTVEGGLEGCPFEVHTVLLPQAVEGQKLQGQQFFANEG